MILGSKHVGAILNVLMWKILCMIISCCADCIVIHCLLFLYLTRKTIQMLMLGWSIKRTVDNTIWLQTGGPDREPIDVWIDIWSCHQNRHTNQLIWSAKQRTWLLSVNSLNSSGYYVYRHLHLYQTWSFDKSMKLFRSYKFAPELQRTSKKE